MLARVLDFALHYRAVVIFTVIAMSAGGIWSFTQLKLEAYPDISDPGVVVVTLYPGFAAEEVEKQVTVPIERALAVLPGNGSTWPHVLS
jgi:heavy metal efflux system protein